MIRPPSAGPAPVPRSIKAVGWFAPRMTRVVGVDAARAEGWVAVSLQDGRLHSMSVHPTLQALLAAEGGADVVAIDLPLGHDDPSGARDRGRRACDAAAREFLGGGRGASVFLVPPPSVLDVSDQTEAVLLCRSKGWTAPSAQVWGLRPRLLEAREVLRDGRVREVHPEVSFRALRQTLGVDAPLEHAKATWAGLVERLELLHAGRLRPERSVGGVGRASPDDVLDATVAAWSAARIATGAASTLPKEPPLDPATGRPVAIWY